MKRLLSIIFALYGASLAVVLAQEAAAPASANLLQDPGFEQDVTAPPWNENNWAKNDVEFVRDTVNPHSGKQAERVTLRKVTGTRTDLQLTYPNLPLKPGMPVQLRFWTRGLPNTKPITISIRQAGAPYKMYFTADLGLLNNWTESVFNFVVPADFAKDAELIFELKEENTFWIDDVSLTELPAQSTEPPLVGNQIKNGSFEVGRDHWYATFRESGGLAHANEASINNANANTVAQIAPEAPDGHRVLAFEVFPSCRIMLTSAYFHLRYGFPASVNFWLKTSEAKVPFSVGLRQGKFPSVYGEQKKFTSSSAQWTFYHFVVTPQASTSGTYFLNLEAERPGKYELDAVNVSEGDSADPSYPKGRTELGWESTATTPAGNLFYPGDAIHFPLNVAAVAGTKTIGVHLRLVDYRAHELKRWTQSIALNPEGQGHADISLPSDRQGGFKVEVHLDGEATAALPETELIYSVVPRLKPPGTEENSFFGGHVDLTPYNLAIAERVGFRWLRLHPPLSTKWMVVEPQKGKFDFNTEGVALAHSMGFHLLGTLGTTPAFYADGDPSKTLHSTWYDSYPPKDWDAWRNYVQKTTTAFGPYISNWEIWNEPDGAFLEVPPGENKAQVYVKILSETRQALQDGGIHAFLVGNAVAHLEGPFTWDELALGGSKEMDAISFHVYCEDSGPEEKQPPLADQLARLRKFPNRSGTVPELWDTEGGIWLTGAHSWLDSAEIPSTVVTNIEDAANTIARTVAALKAMGVKRYFYYGAGSAPSGGVDYRDDSRGMIDTNGIPQPAGAAHAAAVYFLDDAKPVGLERTPIGDDLVTFARFRTSDSTITVIWSRHPVKLGQIPESEWKGASGFEIMGNPLPLSADTDVTLDPIYLINKEVAAPPPK